MAEQITREERRRLHAAEMDANMVVLVRALNAFAGIRTLGSCGGHAVVSNPTQYPEGSWFVKLQVAHDDNGWLALEFLSWAANEGYVKDKSKLLLFPTAHAPHLNTPGQELFFVLEGKGVDPEGFGAWLDEQRISHYVATHKESEWGSGGCAHDKPSA